MEHAKYINYTLEEAYHLGFFEELGVPLEFIELTELYSEFDDDSELSSQLSSLRSVYYLGTQNPGSSRVHWIQAKK